MKREIKFRAWDEPDGYGPSGMSYNVRHDCDADAIMQFTGLLDKNGKEIYEGDIITDGNCSAVVVWTDWGAWAYDFDIQEKYGVVEGYIGDIHDNCEVIGNIYENKDLLTGGTP